MIRKARVVVERERGEDNDGTVNNASASRALFDDINATIKSND